MEYLLTIAIPTFNRARYLGELLPEVIKQAAGANAIRPRVQVIVSDNCSTDGTRGIAERSIAGLDWARYFRNDANVGGDANFILCVERSVGRYVWIFGDDDVIHPSAVGRICRKLENRAPALLICRSETPVAGNFQSYREALARCLPEDLAFPTHHTLITANVFERAAFDTAMAREASATNYGHMYAIMDMLADRERGVCVFSRRGAAFSIRRERAPFAVEPARLGPKLLKYLADLAGAMDYPPLRFSSWLFFSVINRMNALFVPLKESLKRSVKAMARKRR